MRFHHMVLGGILCFVLPATALAEINFRGFGSIIGGKALDDDGIDRFDTFGFNEEVNFRRSSLFALQADTDLGEKLSATIQVMGRGRDNYKLNMEWAYLSYEINDSSKINIGRIRIPFYRYSDYLDVGYAHNWVQTPKTVYLFDFPGYDGISYLGNFSFGMVDTTLQFIYGSLEGDLYSGEQKLEGKLEEVLGGFLTLSYDWLTFKIGYAIADASFNSTSTDSIASIGTGFDAFTIPPFPPVKIDSSALVNSLLVDTDSSSFKGAALGIDYNNFIFDTEIVSYEVEESVIVETHGLFATFGYRFGPVLPTLTFLKKWASPIEGSVYSEIDSLAARSGETIKQMAAAATAQQLNIPIELVLQDPTIIATGQQVAAGVLSSLNDSVVRILKQQEIEEDEEGFDFTIRYDFHPSATFKFSYLLRDREIKEKDIEVVRFGIDFVF